MNFILAVLSGAFGAVLGFVAALAVGYVLTGGMADVNGGRAMFVAFVIGPFGIIAGLLAGVWLPLHFRGVRGRAIALQGFLAAITIVVLSYGGVQIYSELGNDLVVSGNSRPPQLEFEIRLPADLKLPERFDLIKVDLDTDKNTMPSDLYRQRMRRDGDRVVLVGEVELYFVSLNRYIVLKLPGEPDHQFQLELTSRPRYSDTFTAWKKVDYVARPNNAPPRKAEPGDDRYEIRYRVPDPTKPRPKPSQGDG